MTTLRLSPSTAAHHLIATTAQGPRIIATAPTYDVALAAWHELSGQELPPGVRALSVRSAEDPRYRQPYAPAQRPWELSLPEHQARRDYARRADQLIRDAVSAELRATARGLAKTHQGTLTSLEAAVRQSLEARGLPADRAEVERVVKGYVTIGRVPGTRIAYWWPRRQTTLRDARTPDGHRLDQTTLALQATFRRLPA
jgi:hypothetical protein